MSRHSFASSATLTSQNNAQDVRDQNHHVRSILIQRIASCIHFNVKCLLYSQSSGAHAMRPSEQANIDFPSPAHSGPILRCYHPGGIGGCCTTDLLLRRLLCLAYVHISSTTISDAAKGCVGFSLNMKRCLYFSSASRFCAICCGLYPLSTVAISSSPVMLCSSTLGESANHLEDPNNV